MPLYAYKCNQCGHEFEVRQRFSDDPLSECIQCKGEVRRIISSVGIVFKGKGFYVTDNKGRNSAAPATQNGADSAESSPDASTPEKKEKPASSTEKSTKDPVKND